ncbi:hypothetical protein [Polaromonas sp. A23]|uniref:hypothetical protein n=1 Tax=Polaromonas sp. A23 TaxID=1944133 RepID=UPI0011159E7A|nr:hypothetical protein [Polaromonas sp. A23]
MAQLPYSIELHDSTLAAVRMEDGTAVVELRPAYIHRDAKGWTQDADLRIGNAQVDLAGVDLPAELADGRIKSKLGPYHNLLELPLDVPGPLTVTLEVVFSEELIRIAGDGAKVVLHGDPTYVEDVA